MSNTSTTTTSTTNDDTTTTRTTSMMKMMMDSSSMMMSPTQYLDDVLEGHESDEEDLYTDDEAEEEITKEYAILSWLQQTFPRVKDVIAHVKKETVNEWYGQETTMR